MDDPNVGAAHLILKVLASRIGAYAAASLVGVGWMQHGMEAQAATIFAGIVVGAVDWLYAHRSVITNATNAKAGAMLQKVTGRSSTQAAIVTAQNVPPRSAVDPGLPPKPKPIA